MGSVSEDIPPNCGQRLLPTLIDHYAASQPERTFVAVPVSTDLREGWRDVSYLTYSRAINWCSWWIEEHLGRGEDFETISYMGPLDLRYLIILMAATKTGYTVRNQFCFAFEFLLKIHYNRSFSLQIVIVWMRICLSSNLLSAIRS